MAFGPARSLAKGSTNSASARIDSMARAAASNMMMASRVEIEVAAATAAAAAAGYSCRVL
jgi:hypothetical protein